MRSVKELKIAFQKQQQKLAGLERNGSNLTDILTAEYDLRKAAAAWWNAQDAEKPHSCNIGKLDQN